MANGSGMILQGSTAYVLIVVKWSNATVSARLVCVFQIAPDEVIMGYIPTSAERNEESTHRT